MKNLIAISYLSLFLTFEASAVGIDARFGFVAPRQVTCVGISLDNSVVILSYTKDDNNLFVPGAKPIWPASTMSVSYLRNLALQKSNPVAASPGPYLLVNNYLLNSPAVKGTVTSFEQYNYAQFNIELPKVQVQIHRNYYGDPYAVIYLRNPVTGELSYFASMGCK